MNVPLNRCQVAAAQLGKAMRPAPTRRRAVPTGSTRLSAGNLALGMQDGFRDRALTTSVYRSASGMAFGQNRRHARTWSWEIYRNGEPLPARFRADGFKSEYTATLAGRAALRDFLAGLAEEEGEP
jgi:hypothetical protein